MAQEKVKIMQPDRKRCQVEWKTRSLTTDGNPVMERCVDAPDWIATDIALAPGCRLWSISMCDVHRNLYERAFPNKSKFKVIRRGGRASD